MYPYAFGNEHIPMYGVCFIVGIIASLMMLLFYVRKRSDSVNKDDSLYSSCFALVGGILGAKLLSILINIENIIKYNIPIYDVIRNGFVFYGGLIGGFLGYLIYAKAYKLKVFSLVDQGAQVLPLGHGIGRIGCFCAGCCYGKETDSFLGVIYTHPSDPLTPVGVKLLPTQLFETGYCLLIFFALFALNRLYKLKTGVNTTIYIVSYGIFRFINEFFRNDFERGQLFGLSTSQWISMILIIAIGVYWLVKFANSRKNQRPLTAHIKES